MEFNDVVNHRKAIRSFDPNKPISDELIEKIMVSAQRTPSWTNSQPWKVYVATGATLAEIKADHLERTEKRMKGYSDLNVIHRTDWGPLMAENSRVWNAEISAYLGEAGLANFSDLQRHLFNAPVIIYLTVERDVSPWMIYDMGAFSQSILLAAANEQVDTIPAYETAKYPDAVRKIVGIPENELLIGGIAMGYHSEGMINAFHSQRSSVASFLTIKH
ncbi:nitroreductase [Latilactobacillus curvatus]|uniref:nitroreductase n=1 Tax=Latilactobacillus curvatus TaxID=28038 RepID=UPI00240FDCE6|nr:nitroreductase [Latilactobacillus curvatus]MDG2977206.1 nitroreductase [Latilactobacillus curvatus]